MTPLTKIFIVFHVILSLMLAAGLIVFVNRTEDFKATNLTVTAKMATANAQASSAKTALALQITDAGAARHDRDVAISEAQQKQLVSDGKIASLQADKAALQSSANIAQINADNTSAALLASETARKALADILEATRTTNNDIAKKNSDLNIAVADLTNKLEVATRQVTNLIESNAEYKTLAERLGKQLADAGLQPKTETGLSMGAPPIDGIIVSRQQQGGIPYATISVGSQDQVKRGMKFSIVDREKGKFLGELTVEQVDEQQATGRLEGPGLSDIQAGKTEVKTQL